MPELTPLLAASGVFFGAAAGFFLRGLFSSRDLRHAARQAWRENDRLWRDRILQDRRDDAPLQSAATRTNNQSAP